MRKNVTPHPVRSNEEIALLLAETRNNERLRCAGIISGRLEALAAFIATRRLEWCDVAELLRQEASHIDTQAQELH